MWRIVKNHAATLTNPLTPGNPLQRNPCKSSVFSRWQRSRCGVRARKAGATREIEAVRRSFRRLYRRGQRRALSLQCYLPTSRIVAKILVAAHAQRRFAICCIAELHSAERRLWPSRPLRTRPADCKSAIQQNTMLRDGGCGSAALGQWFVKGIIPNETNFWCLSWELFQRRWDGHSFNPVRHFFNLFARFFNQVGQRLSLVVKGLS